MPFDKLLRFNLHGFSAKRDTPLGGVKNKVSRKLGTYPYVQYGEATNT